VAEYIAAMDLSAFVMDYDNNAPTPEWLRDTHEPFFRIIRKAQPKLPVIFVSRPPLMGSDENPERIEIIKQTYQNALDAGDKHVYFINGSEFFDAFAGDAATVDGCHPNDYGFVLMALGILPVLEKALKEAE
jgi:lysophospholipase L1-like esterase